MKNKKAWIILSVVVFIAVAITVITSIQNSVKKEDETIKIGAILPLTGPASFSGEVARRGIDMANEDLEKKGIKLQILYQDSQADPKRAIDAFKQLVDLNKIKVVMSLISQVSLALKQEAERQKIVLFANVPHPEMTKSTNFVFRMSPTIQTELREFINFLKDKSLQNKLIILFYQTDEYGTAFVTQLKSLPEYSGYSFDIKEYDPKQTEFRSIIVKTLDNKKPSAISVVGFGNSLGILIKQIRESGYRDLLYASLGFIITDAFRLAGDAADGVYHPDLYIDTASPMYLDLVGRFKARFGRDMQATEWLFYNTVLLISKIYSDKDLTSTQITEKVRDLKSFQGIGGTFEIQPNGDIIPPVRLAQYKKKGE